MKTVKSLLKAKGQDIWSIEPDASVYDAIHYMAEREIGALLVMDGSKLVGIISERDYARQVILKGRASESTKVKEIMTTKMFHATIEHETSECMVLMTDNRIRHLPILDGDKVLGVISIGDLVRSIISEQDSTIADLEKYISG
jgi:CBS domain-containing protein